MGVFLRWGVFGILSVAALVYAYNAGKRMAEHPPKQPLSTLSPPADSGDTAAAEPEPENLDELSPRCRSELLAARRAVQGRKDGEPLDRVLRTQEVAFESNESQRRRLERIATDWFWRENVNPWDPELRSEILRRCR